MNKYSQEPLMDNRYMDEISADRDALDRVAALFKALSDPSRLKILASLWSGELNVGGISERLGLSDSAVSHQLRSLRQMRLVRSRKQGREVYYSLDDEHISQLYKIGLDHVQHG